MARYKVTKDQLERIVENFVMEQAPVKDYIPSQGAEAKKHIKNKMSGDMVDQSEGMPSVGQMKKKLSQSPEAKKHISKTKATHSNKAKLVRESYREQLVNEGIKDMWDKLKQWYGSEWSEEKAKQSWNQVYLKNAEKLAKAYANGVVEDFKNAAMNFMKKNGTIPILDGRGKNAEWDDNTKSFKRLSSKLGGPGGVVGG